MMPDPETHDRAISGQYDQIRPQKCFAEGPGDDPARQGPEKFQTFFKKNILH
jgi:hypothetical protein